MALETLYTLDPCHYVAGVSYFNPMETVKMTLSIHDHADSIHEEVTDLVNDLKLLMDLDPEGFTEASKNPTAILTLHYNTNDHYKLMLGTLEPTKERYEYHSRVTMTPTSDPHTLADTLIGLIDQAMDRDPPQCRYCSGTGIGAYGPPDTTVCPHCRGKG